MARFLAMPGLGARGTVDGQHVIIGREDLFTHLGMTVPASLAEWCRGAESDGQHRGSGRVGRPGRGAIAIADTDQADRRGAVTELRRLGLRTVLLTGDSQATARAVGARAGTDEVIAGALPARR